MAIARLHSAFNGFSSVSSARSRRPSSLVGSSTSHAYGSTSILAPVPTAAVW